MKLPASVLSSVRGPLVVLALAGCQEPARIEPEPVTAPPAPVVEAPPPEAIDPVAYDACTESVRLARADDVEMHADARRSRRIEAARPRRVVSHSVGLGTIGTPGHSWYGAGCGRG